MLFLIGLLTGGTLLTGAKLRKNNNKLANNKEHTVDLKDKVLIKKEPKDIVEKDHNLLISTTSLGFIISGQILFSPLTFIGVTGLIYLVWPTWKQAYYDITQKKRFTRMVLEAIILPGSILLGQYFIVALSYSFLYFSLNKSAKAKDNVSKNLNKIFTHPSNRLVYVIRDNVEVELLLSDVQKDDILVIGAGETIPIDGTIIRGHSTIDQQHLTGEFKSIEKQVNDYVFASSLLLSGQIHVCVDKTGKEILSNQGTQILNEMTQFTDHLELRGTDLGNKLSLPLFLLGSATSAMKGVKAGMAIVWMPLDDALYSMGPLSVLNYLNIAMKHNILIKDGRTLEILRKVDTFIFDKTGTLTKEIPLVAKIHNFRSSSQKDILYYAAAAEQKQEHPIALAILKAASIHNIKLPSITDNAYITGYGITVMLENEEIQVGSYRFMEKLSIKFPDNLNTIKLKADDSGYSLIYIAVNNNIIGIIELHTQLRADTVSTIDTLQRLGHRVCIISGDHESPTQHLAKQLGIKHYFSEILPQDKSTIIKNMQKEGRVVCYIGDGINDTIALKQAEVSISLQGASSLAIDTAHIILMDGEIKQLIKLITLAKELEKTHRKIILSSAIPSIIIVGGVLFVHLRLTASIITYISSMAMSLNYAMFPLLKDNYSTQKEKNSHSLDEEIKK